MEENLVLSGNSMSDGKLFIIVKGNSWNFMLLGNSESDKKLFLIVIVKES